jgi:glutaredoxin-like protein
MLSDTQKEQVRKRFQTLANDVELIVLTQDFECQLCRETRELVLELGSLSPKIRTKVYDLVKDEEEAKKYNIKKIPAIAIVGSTDYGIRYYGVPSGYEFSVFVDDIVDVSKGNTSLPDSVKKKLAEIKKPVHMQVFVSSTCPFCPKAARVSRQLAIENEHIRSDVIEMTAFPYLAQRYGVMSVPYIVINEDTSFVGAHPPEIFIEQIAMALGKSYNPMYS